MGGTDFRRAGKRGGGEGEGGRGRTKDFGRGKERTQTSGCTNRRSLHNKIC